MYVSYCIYIDTHSWFVIIIIMQWISLAGRFYVSNPSNNPLREGKGKSEK